MSLSKMLKIEGNLILHLLIFQFHNFLRDVFHQTASITILKNPIISSQILLFI